MGEYAKSVTTGVAPAVMVDLVFAKTKRGEKRKLNIKMIETDCFMPRVCFQGSINSSRLDQETVLGCF